MDNGSHQTEEPPKEEVLAGLLPKESPIAQAISRHAKKWEPAKDASENK